MILTLIQFIGIYFILKFIYFIISTTCESFYCKILSKFKPIDLPKTYGAWAVVTGSTDGIGKAYAIQLAKRKMNLVLISRNMEKLKNTAEYIQSLHPVEVRVIQADFSDGKKIYEAIENEIKNLDIGILVNNVGIASNPLFQKFENIPDDHLWNEIIVNVGATTLMTKMILPQMKLKQRGAIVNLGSMSSLRPFPYLSHYGSTKAFMSQLSKNLQIEFSDENIFIQHLAPGIINTNMTKNNAFTENRFSKNLESFLNPNATLYASWAISSLGILKNSTGYWVFDVLKCIGLCFPDFIHFYVLNKLLKIST